MLLEAVDEVIDEVLGPAVLRSLYIALESQYDVTRDEIPYRIETAHKMLREVFGVQGSTTLSKIIARRLYQKLDLEFEEVNGLQLVDYIEITKGKLPQKQAAKRFATALKKLSTKPGTQLKVREGNALPDLPDTSDLLILNALKEKEELKINEIAEQVGIPIPTVQRRVNDMVEKLLIVRFVRINGTQYSITRVGKSALLRHGRKPTKNDNLEKGNGT